MAQSRALATGEHGSQAPPVSSKSGVAHRIHAAVQRAQPPALDGPLDRPSPDPKLNHLRARDYSVLPSRQIRELAPRWARFDITVMHRVAHPARVERGGLQRGDECYFRRKALMRSAYWSTSRL